MENNQEAEQVRALSPENCPPVEDLLEQELVVEAVLFTMGHPVEARQLAAALGQDEDCAQKAAQRLKKRYNEERKGLQIIELENAFQMCTRSMYYEYLIRVASAPKRQVLTDVVLETLSIIAYQQPITKLEIEKIRGVKSDHAVNKLIEYNLVCEVGRLDAPGRPVLFATTEEFLRRFGIGSTEDLPGLKPEQEEEIKSEVAAELKMAVEEIEADAGDNEDNSIVKGEEKEADINDSKVKGEEKEADASDSKVKEEEKEADVGDSKVKGEEKEIDADDSRVEDEGHEENSKIL